MATKQEARANKSDLFKDGQVRLWRKPGQACRWIYHGMGSRVVVVFCCSMPKLWRWRQVVSPSISSLQEFFRAKSNCHLYGGQG
ncbi:hypothetical protein TNCV_2118911 [Trichonephila clavipes]|nr:hypothetical protein TNCV_2118911 [Trichonephila clavipes]